MKIVSLELKTGQAQKLKEFYTQVLGLPLLDDDSQHFIIQAGFSTITFQASDEQPAGHYHFAFNIPSNSIQKAAKWLQDHVAFLHGPGASGPVVKHESWEASAIYFYDPDFNIIEFIAHKRAPTSTAPFSSAQIFGLAEVGFPVPDVAAFGKELREKLGLARWKSASAGFEAIGNEAGMFILVEENRPWFPTQNPAVALPTRVEVETNRTVNIRHGALQLLSSNASALA
jgi:catechol-2,3-dioxygenase